MSDDLQKGIERLARELHSVPARSLRRALRENSNGADRSMRRRLDVLLTEVAELHRSLVDVAHDLFVLAGQEDFAREVLDAQDELVNALDGARTSTRVCKGCGCTDANACHGGCGWASATMCTRCKARLTGKKNG
jgi:hypothetical protein